MTYASPTQSPHGPQPAATDRWNVLAIVGFVLAFFLSLGAVICGHIALSQIDRTGEQGRGLAIAALVLGYLGILFGVLMAVLWAGLLASTAASGGFGS